MLPSYDSIHTEVSFCQFFSSWHFFTETCCISPSETLDIIEGHYIREQRAKRTCWHVHLATAARAKCPVTCGSIWNAASKIMKCEVMTYVREKMLYSKRVTGNPWSQQTDNIQPSEEKWVPVDPGWMAESTDISKRALMTWLDKLPESSN